MCLDIFKKNEKERIATSDIVVYKVLVKTKSNKLLTPYLASEVEIGKNYESELNFHQFLFDIDFNSDLLIGFVQNGLHSYANKEDAYNATRKRRICTDKLIIVECVIPKGSHYFIGRFNGCDSFASSELKYVKICSKFKCFINNLINL